MQSKTSSFDFNKTIFKNNRKHLWPLWVGYSFLILWVFPGVLYFNSVFTMSLRSKELKNSILYSIYYSFYTGSVIIALIFGIIFATALFSYLQNDRANNFYHALPLTKDSLYFTELFSGLIMMFIPNLAAFLLSNIICWANGINCMSELTTWLLVFTTEELFFFSFAILCTIIIGHSVIAPVVYFILVFLVQGILLPINDIGSQLFYGIENSYINIPSNSFGIVAPVSFFLNFDISNSYKSSSDITEYSINGVTKIIIVGLIVTALFVIASVLLYRQRKAEATGDVVAISFLKPVFKWGFGICFSLVVSWLLIATLFSSFFTYKTLRVVSFFVLIIMALIGYFIAEMLVQKSVAIFKHLKRDIIGYSILCVFISVILLLGSFSASKIVPKNKDIEKVYIQMGNCCYTFENAEDIEGILAIHKYIIENYDRLAYKDSIDAYSIGSIVIEYRLAKDAEIDRRYLIPSDETELINKIIEFGDKHLIEFSIGNYKAIDYDYASLLISNNDSYNEWYTLTKSQTDQLLAAYIKDIQDGNITFESYSSRGGYYWSEYSLPSAVEDTNAVEDYYFSDSDEIINSKDMLYTNYNTIEFLKKYQGDEDYIVYSNSASIYYDKTCTNIIECLSSFDYTEGYYFDPERYYY